jgi:hypothetical protein
LSNHAFDIVTRDSVAKAPQSSLVEHRCLSRFGEHIYQQRRHERDCLVEAIANLLPDFVSTNNASHAPSHVLAVQQTLIASAKIKSRERQ